MNEITAVNPWKMSAGRLCGVMLLLLITVAAYYPSLKGGFLGIDDQVMVFENPRIMSLTPHNLTDMWLRPHFGLYHPLVLMSYALEYRLFGADPLMFRMTNMYLHVCNTVLLWALFLLLTRSAPAAFAVALLFGIHPQHLESVAWISERKDVLYAFFFLVSLLSYVRYRHTGAVKLLALSLAMFLCSLLSKPMAVTLPLVLVLMDLMDENRQGRTRVSIRLYLPYLLLALAFAVVTVATHYPAGSGHKLLPIIARNSAAVFATVVFYVEKTFLPVHLSILYPLSAAALTPVQALAWLGGFVVVTAALWRFERRAVWGLLFFGITIVPVLNVLPIGIAAVADRYMYVPAAGLFYAAAVCVRRLLALPALSRPIARPAVVLVLAAVAAALFVSARRRAELWSDNFLLFSDVIAAYPDASSVAYNIRGLSYDNKGLPESALRDYLHAVRLDRSHKEGWLNAGNSYLALARYEEALAAFQQSVAVDPKYAAGWAGIGRTYAAQKDYARALVNFEKSREIDPRRVLTLLHHADVMLKQHNYAGALDDAREVLQIDPRSIGGLMLAGDLYSRDGDFSRALPLYRRAAEIHESNGNALYGLGRAVAALSGGQGEVALPYYSRAVAVQPNHAAAFAARGNALMQMGDYRRAHADYTTAIRLVPGWIEPVRRRAVADFILGRTAVARRDIAELKRRNSGIDASAVPVINDWIDRAESAVSAELKQLLGTAPRLP